MIQFTNSECWCVVVLSRALFSLWANFHAWRDILCNWWWRIIKGLFFPSSQEQWASQRLGLQVERQCCSFGPWHCCGFESLEGAAPLAGFCPQFRTFQIRPSKFSLLNHWLFLHCDIEGSKIFPPCFPKRINSVFPGVLNPSSTSEDSHDVCL